MYINIYLITSARDHSGSEPRSPLWLRAVRGPAAAIPAYRELRRRNGITYSPPQLAQTPPTRQSSPRLSAQGEEDETAHGRGLKLGNAAGDNEDTADDNKDDRYIRDETPPRMQRRIQTSDPDSGEAAEQGPADSGGNDRRDGTLAAREQTYE
eukprot:GHVU01015404.1.p3 GENE.GHVU01015404.1~~GHVU01015404.1.p3  ORF type:complete len:153 (+),score=19.28 GHVU01015404.1:736-1194(+)